MTRTACTSILSLILALGAAACGDDDRTDENLDMGGGGDAGECVRTEDNETTEALCGDGLDNDCDGNADCLDFGCNGTTVCEMVECTPTGVEDTPETCNDGIDQDCNGFIDCRDFSCTGIGECGVENSNATCADGIDNDNDGNLDCEDFDCLMDGVGLNVCSRESTNANCSDGADNDGDGLIDCLDDDCAREHIVVCGPDAILDEAMWPAAVEAACSNGLNDDGDMTMGRAFIDCGDFDCANTLETDVCHDLPRENTNALCSDGIDNDMDGQTDCADFGCQNGEQIVVCNGMMQVDPRPSDAEITTMANALCEDGLSPDGDTFVDCEDFDCTGDPLVTVCPVENTDALCSDGINNNESPTNTFTDCEDFSCSRNLNVTVCADAVENTTAECTDGIDNDGNGFLDCGDNNCSNNDAACGSNAPAP